MTSFQIQEHWAEIFTGDLRGRLEAAIQSWLPARRWFGGKARTIKSVGIVDAIPVLLETDRAFLTLLRVEYTQAGPELYVLPLACAFGEKAEAVGLDLPAFVLARLSAPAGNRRGVLYDAIADKSFCRAILELIANRRSLAGEKGNLDAMHTEALQTLRRESGLALEPSVSKAEQSNSSIIYGNRLILKFFRRLEGGVNPELEIGRFLTERKFSGSPPLAGALEYRRPNEDALTVAILSYFVPGCKTAWDYTLEVLSRFYERVQTLPADRKSAPTLGQAAGELPEEVRQTVGSFLREVRLLGERTASMHLALASEKDDPNFRPEPWTPDAQRALFQSMQNLTRQNFRLVGQRLESLSPEVQAQARQLLTLESALIQRLKRVEEVPLQVVRTRYHGDYHLGQILYTGQDFLIIDFEGEPAVALSERRLKRSPLRDVAGMILSFRYAAHAALLKLSEGGLLQGSQMQAATRWGRYWSGWVSATYLKAYLEYSQAASYIPSNPEHLPILLEAELLRNAVYELGYELNNRPDWVKIPIQAVIELMNQANAT